ncbi:MAG TPA: hypothetical protein VGS97_05065 [Actinocrinis sp.]|uniref:deazapurine DNA modification protein DpdA family protein n=1 Tax=Actinocrinis sp. TaxID=1920516 RepID=UPI002DDD8432|nr:hypothetical protein [Actinocrinis sp.]HEV2343443.1 hypothetical protein [Actinocrinis sp.]
MRRRELVDARRDRNEAGSAKPNTLRHTSSQLAPDPDACAVGKVGSFLHLKELAPDLPFIPVLQGWSLADYDACHERYQREGIDLARQPVVGLGSVCRRQTTAAIALLAAHFANLSIRLHGFGVSTRGLGNFAADLVSADSMAWSKGGRFLRGCAHGTGAKNEANCPQHALAWRSRVLAKTEPAARQLAIPGL